MIASLRGFHPMRRARERFTRRQLTVGAALAATYVIWSTTFAAIAIALRGLPPLTLSGLRFTAAALIMLAVALVARQVRPTAREAAGSAFLSLFFVTIANGALTWAEQWVATGTAALLGAISPLFLLAAQAVLPGGDRPTIRGAVGVLIGFAGVAMLMGPTASAGGPGALQGELALVAAAALCGVGLLMAPRVPKPTSWVWHSAITMLAGGLTLGALGAGLGELGRVDLAAVPAESWLGFAYLVIFGSCLGFSAFSYLTQHARPMLVSTISYVIPLLATILGAAMLHETVTPAAAAAAALIVGSVALVATGGKHKDVEVSKVGDGEPG